MRCHFIYDKAAGKVLIPGCWEAVLSDDIRRCTCRKPVHKEGETFAQFEKVEYNLKLREMKDVISGLEKEVSRLNRIINKLNQKP